MLESIKIVSTDQNWREVFIEGDKSKGEIFKALEMKRLGVYFACGNPNNHDKLFFKICLQTMAMMSESTTILIS